jgi:hypothetical protein
MEIHVAHTIEKTNNMGYRGRNFLAVACMVTIRAQKNIQIPGEHMNNWCTPPTNMYKEKNKNKDDHSRSWQPT